MTQMRGFATRLVHEIGSTDWFMRLVQQGFDLLRLVLVALVADDTDGRTLVFLHVRIAQPEQFVS